jgi:hypothetical protein
MSSGLRWVLLALVGLLVAGAVAFLAIRTVSERIGISSEPPTAGSALAPGTRAPAPKKPSSDGGGSSAAPAKTTGQPPPQPQPVPVPGGTGDGGEGEGEGDDD